MIKGAPRSSNGKKRKPKKLTWSEAKKFGDIYKEVLTTEHHGHEIIMDEHGTIRWKRDVLVDEFFNRGYLDLNSIMAGLCKSHVGINPKIKVNPITKNDEVIRAMYRRFGYSLFGYWEIFYWETNNEDSEAYVYEDLIK